jgi:signal transduction histidine kinase
MMRKPSITRQEYSPVDGVSAGRHSDSARRILAALAHELNSLLDGSMRSIYLARRDLAASGPTEGIERRLDAAGRSMSRMAALLDQAMRRPQAGLDLFAGDQTVAQEIASVIEQYADAAAAAGVTIDHHLDPEAAEVAAGPLGIVLANGLRNAIEAIQASGRPGGVVHLRGTVGGQPDGDDRLELRVVDNGPGLERTAGRSGGHGIGLALCRAIVEALGGEISLDARSGPGVSPGAVLHLSVPLRILQKR